MYKEELVLDIKKCEDKKYRASLLGEFYFANLGLVVTMCNNYGVAHGYHEDFMQLAYLALDKAVKSYDSAKGYSILSYYRIWLKHECYKFWLQTGSGNEVCMELVNTDYESKSQYNEMSKMFSKVEVDFMNKLLWDRVSNVLCDRDTKIIRRRFNDKCTLRVIAEEQCISIERVRQRILKACLRLQGDVRVQEVALYYNFM